MTSERSTRSAGYANNQVYDLVGNPTVLRSARPSSLFNADNQVTSFNSPNGTTTSSFAYDGDGNPTTYKGNTLAFDDEDRLTSYSRGGVRLMSAYYNGTGQRIAKISGASTSSASKTFYVYSGGTTPLLEFSSTGAMTAINTVGLTGLVSRATPTSDTFYTFDPQGNVSATLDKSGNVVGKDMFDAFGSRVSSDNSADPYTGFGGQWGYRQDTEAGLELLGARYYDVATGRFLTRDPIGYAGGLDLYTYAGNNPVNSADPSGLCPGAPGDSASGPGNYGMPAAWAGVGDAVNPIKAAQGLGALAWKLPSGEVSLGDLGTGFAHSLNPFEKGISDREMGTRLTGDVLLFAGGLGAISKLRALAVAGRTAALADSATAAAERASALHSVLDPIAQQQRGTAVLKTSEGVDVVGAGVRDLSPAQRALLGPSEISAKLPGEHGEITVLQSAFGFGLTPQALGTSFRFCDDCRAAIEASGGTITGPTTAIWK